ncbi:MAG: DUF4337 domain-containing protein [Reyranellales bacterium]
MAEGLGEIEGSNKKIAILIAILAALLAIAETGAKSAQTEVLTQHVEATNQWGFFQAKTIRQTVIRTAAEEIEAQYKDAGTMPAAVKAQVDKWRATANRYDSEPQTNEGRKELSASAMEHGAKREKARAAYHMFEFGSAAFQLAIVLASAAAVTSVVFLVFVAAGLGLAGAALTALGFLAPTLIHL